MIDGAVVGAPKRGRARVDSWPVGVGAAVAIALALRALFGASPLDSTDVTFTLIWGRELAGGDLPDYDVVGAITPHPLYTLLGAVASVFGTDGAFGVVRAVAFLSFGALVWGVFLLGRAAFGTASGVLAGVALATNPVILSTPFSGTSDIPALAAVVFAAVLAVRDPHRSTPVFLMLFVAGLLRPEAWLIAGIYWLSLASTLDGPGRARTAALALAAPVTWGLADALVTGNPALALTHTQDVVSEFNRRAGLADPSTGLAHVPSEYVNGLRALLRPPELIGGAAGLGLWVWLRSRVSAVPTALLVLGSLEFLAYGVAGLSLQGRFLLIPATMLVVLFGLAVFGWREQPEPGIRRAWAAGGLALLAVYLAFAPAELRALSDLRSSADERIAIRTDLADMLKDGAPLLERCPEVHAAGLKLVPLVGYYLDRSTDTIRSADLRSPVRGGVVVPNDEAAGAGFVTPEGLVQLRRELRRGDFMRAARNDSWSLYVNGC